MDLDTIVQEWKTDSPIDQTKLGNEALEVSPLHQKYLTYMYSQKKELRALKRQQKALERSLESYYTGKIDGKDIGREPFQEVVSKTRAESLINTDPEMATLVDKIEECEDVILYAKDVVERIKWRNQDVKNYIEWNKFLNGSTL